MIELTAAETAVLELDSTGLPIAELTPWWLDKNKDQRQAFFLYKFLPALREAADTRDFLARALEVFRVERGDAKHISGVAK